MGAHFNKQWTYAKWPINFVKDYQPSIEFLELYGLAVAVYIWAKQLENTRALVFCDNEAVVYMINNSSSSCKQCMKLIRGIILKGLKFNFRIFARHFRSEENEVADSLSRLQFQCFKQLKERYKLRAVPEPMPSELWLVTKIWNADFFG